MSLVRSFLILVIISCSFIVTAQTIVPKQENGKWGLANQSGDWIIPATYENIGWSDGSQMIAQGVIGYQKNGFWGLLSDKGKRITNPIYRSITHDGGNLFIASSLGKLSRRVLYGLIDEKGRVISSFKYLNITKGYSNQYIVGEPKEGRTMAGVIVPGERGVIPLASKKITLLNKGQYLLQSWNNLFGVTDMDGQRILPVKYDELILTPEDNFVLNQQGLLGSADRNGAIIHPVNAKRLTANRLEKFPAWSIRDAENKTLDQIYADSIQPLEGKRLLIFRNQKQTVYQSNSELPGSFEDAVIVNALDNALIVKSERGYEVLWSNGNPLLKSAYDSIYVDAQYFYTLKITEQGDQWYLFSRTGTRLTKSPVNGLLPASEKRIRFQQEGFWGIFDFDGSILVQPKYDTILPFVKKKAIVSQRGEWGVIDNQNQWVILPYENNLKMLNNGLYVSQKGYHIKFFNQLGDHVKSITTKFKEAGKYVKIYGESSKIGLMSPTGRMMTSIAYDDIQLIPESELFFVRIDSVAGIIDQFEHTILPFTHKLEAAIGIDEGLIGVKMQGKYGFINLRGQLIIANRYDDIQLFSEGLAAYKLNGKWGFLDTQENLVIQPFYDEVLPFNHEGLTAVRDGEVWGLINKEGTVVERLRYQRIRRNKQGKYEISSSQGTGLLAGDGTQIFLPTYEILQDIGGEKAVVKKNGKWGVVNYDGTYFIPTLFQQVVYSADQGYFLIKENK